MESNILKITTEPPKETSIKLNTNINSLAESIELAKALRDKKQDKPRKLKYTFHNPNTSEETADFLIKLFVEINYPKLEAAILKKIQEQENQEPSKEEN